jgi:hypothetical protein
MPVKVAQDRYLRCVQAAAGLNEFTNFSLPDKPGDTCNLLAEGVPVVFPQVTGSATRAGTDAARESIIMEITFGRTEPPLRRFEVHCRVVKEIEPGVTEDRSG